MRILLDLQPAQTAASATRGVGRYAMALAAAMIRRAPQHKFSVLLNECFPETVSTLRKHLAPLVPRERIFTFSVPPRISPATGASDWRRAAAGVARQAAIRQIAPDHVHAFNLFEGLGEDAIVACDESFAGIATSVTLHDIIPFVLPDLYLGAPVVRQWYHQTLRSLLRADLLLANSEASRRDAIYHLSCAEDAVVNVSSAVDDIFRPIDVPVNKEADLRKRYGLDRPFVLYCGGIDARKNVDGLITAFARLPEEIRQARQLAIVCSVEPAARTTLVDLATSLGLAQSDVILTGFIPDDELLAVYNFAELFVFPSLYEGFGLPVLEAMACGVPVIGADTSSIPEVIGDTDSLFDPKDPEAIAAKMAEVLSDPDRLQAMSRRGRKRSQLFSWDAVADKAMKAIEMLHESRAVTFRARPVRRLRLAYISPLWPLQTGIATYSHVLVLELLRYFEIDLVTEQDNITDTLLGDMLPIRSVDYFERNYDRYDRVLYQFGNSEFHQYMFPLLKRCPGTVVLHDLFLSGIMHWSGNTDPGNFERVLVSTHGYDALADHLDGPWDKAIWKYPCNGDVIENAAGIIVHSDFSRQALVAAGVPTTEIVHIPHLRETATTEREPARYELGFEPDEFVICAFGHLGPTKLNHVTAQAFRLLNGPGRRRLIFVGPVGEDAYFDAIKSVMAEAGAPVEITGFVDKATYHRHLAAADLAIQLRTNSRGETSGAILDCLAYGLPTVISDEGPAAEYPDTCVVKIVRDAPASLLASTLRDLETDVVRRKTIGATARQFVREHHHPAIVGRFFREAIEQLAPESRIGRLRCALDEMHDLPGAATETLSSKADIARALALNLRRPGRPRLFIDVSEIVRRDWKSGIQRVVRHIVTEFLRTPRLPCRVVPIYADPTADWLGFRHARRFAEELLGITEHGLLGEEEAIEIAADDIFLGLDLFPGGVVNYAEHNVFATWRARGAHIFFVVYDLIAIYHPEFFVPGAREGHARWMRAVAQAADALFCISEAVADDVRRFLDTECPCADHPIVRHFPLGCDVGVAARKAAATLRSEALLPALENAPTFLMVGTLEPRKGHLAVLDAFDELWASGSAYRLTIVGKVGWMADNLTARLKNHPEANRKLIWYEAASDEDLARLYVSTSGLIAASYSEGFGLPLVEAGFLGLPILARDIPVFREIADGHATFFSDDNSLTSSIETWGRGLVHGNSTPSSGMPLTTWKESASRLAQLLGETAGLISPPHSDVTRSNEEGLELPPASAFADAGATLRRRTREGSVSP